MAEDFKNHPIITLITIVGFIGLIFSYNMPILSDFKLNDIKNDVMSGDILIVTGTAKYFVNQNLTVSITDNSGNYYAEKEVIAQEGKFAVKFDTTSFQSGQYNVVVKKDKLAAEIRFSPGKMYTMKKNTDKEIMDIRTIRIIDSNVEGIVITPASFTYGSSPIAIVSLKNTESREKNLNLNLLLDGALIQSKNVQIKPNSFENIVFV